MLDNLNLIHMNGRVQDPVLGRFASADPFIANPDDTQAFNRYSYVRNSPLTFGDPSGFVPVEIPIPCAPYSSRPQGSGGGGQGSAGDGLDVVTVTGTRSTCYTTIDIPIPTPDINWIINFPRGGDEVVVTAKRPQSEPLRKHCTAMSLPSDSRIADVRTSTDYYHTYTRYHFTLPGDAEIAPNGSIVPAGVAVGAYLGSAGGMAYGTYAGAAHGAAHGRNLGIVFGTMAVGEAAASGAVLGGLYGGIFGAVVGAGVGVTVTNGMKVSCGDPG
jgi:RHS repeat-associated protein